jgi:hypothetical protein
VGTEGGIKMKTELREKTSKHLSFLELLFLVWGNLKTCNTKYSSWGKKTQNNKTLGFVLSYVGIFMSPAGC